MHGTHLRGSQTSPSLSPFDSRAYANARIVPRRCLRASDNDFPRSLVLCILVRSCIEREREKETEGEGTSFLINKSGKGARGRERGD